MEKGGIPEIEGKGYLKGISVTGKQDFIWLNFGDVLRSYIKDLKRKAVFTWRRNTVRVSILKEYAETPSSHFQLKIVGLLLLLLLSSGISFLKMDTMKDRVLAPGKERLRNLAGKTLGHMHRYQSVPWQIQAKKIEKPQISLLYFLHRHFSFIISI